MILLQQSIRQSSLEMVEGEAIRKILFTRYSQRKFGLSNLKKLRRAYVSSFEFYRIYIVEQTNIRKYCDQYRQFFTNAWSWKFHASKAIDP